MQKIIFWTLSGLVSGGAYAQGMIANLISQQQQIQSGRELFVLHCAGCHGMDAQGAGPAAPMLSPKPRNLVTGSFRFRSTPAGSLPTWDDLLRTLDRGVIGTSMPSFREMSSSQKNALVAYIRSLRPDWKSLQSDPVFLPPVPREIFGTKATLLASAYRGRKLYEEACLTCHGDKGHGDGPSAEGLLNETEEPIQPRNLAQLTIKSGAGAADLFRAITTGLDGTPMPSFLDVYTPDQRWDIVAYVMYLRGQTAGIYPADLVLAPPSAPSKTKKAAL